MSDRLVGAPDRRLVLPAVDCVDVVFHIGHLVEHFGAHGTREGVSFMYLLVSGQSYACPEALAALGTRKPRRGGRYGWDV